MRFAWIIASALVFSACGGGGDDDTPITADAHPDATVSDAGPDGAVSDASSADADDTQPDAGDVDASSPDAGPTILREDCTNGVDDDGDTMADCTDRDCTASIECLADFTCPADQTKLYLRSSDLPLFIQPLMSTTSMLNVPITGQVTRAAVQMSIRHDLVADLDVFLVAPGGTQLLVSNNEGFGRNFERTILADDGLTTLSNGDPPYAGVFRPDTAFSSLIGVAAGGTWQLRVDETEGDDRIGALSEYALALCVCDGCELGAACTNGMDDDGDNMTDCADPDCSGEDACALASMCAPGEVLVHATPANLPLSIPDSSSVSTTIPVMQSGTVRNVGVRFSITHTFDADLSMDLSAPGMTSVTLFDGVGSSSDNFTDTVLVDSAATFIDDGSAPFTGVFRPTSPFSAFAGLAAAGNWTLTMHDNAGADVGSVTAYELFICVAP